jgi:hypothetical protein
MEDFNDAGEQSDVIPAGTVATVQLTVRPGGAGDGWLKRAKDGNSEALDCEFVLLDGQYAKRKFWDLFTLSGTTENHADYGQKSRATIRAMLESVHGINPKDKSEEAKKARAVENFGGLNGLRFMARIGVQPAKDGYKAKNRLDEVITPERKDWRKVEQLPPEQRAATTAAPAATTTGSATAEPAPANAVDRPKWAKKA